MKRIFILSCILWSMNVGSRMTFYSWQCYFAYIPTSTKPILNNMFWDALHFMLVWRFLQGIHLFINMSHACPTMSKLLQLLFFYISIFQSFRVLAYWFFRPPLCMAVSWSYPWHLVWFREKKSLHPTFFLSQFWFGTTDTLDLVKPTFWICWDLVL